LAATWVIGEYGDALLRGSGGEVEDDEIAPPPSEHEVVDLFASILSSSYSGQIVTQYIITSAMKLTTRLSDTSQIEKIHRILGVNQTNLDVEIQQRAVEYGNLFSYHEIMKGVLEKMPAPEIREEQRVLGEAPKKNTPKKSKKPSQLTEQDLLGLVGSDEPSVPAVNGSQNNADLLMDILGGSSSGPTSQSPPPSQQKSNVDSIMSLFGNSGTSSPAPASFTPQHSASADLLGGLGGASAPPSSSSPAPSAPLEAYNRNGLHITFQLQRNAQAIQAMVRFRNVGASKLSSVQLQAAVPKTQKLQLQAITSSDISPGGEATQLLRVTGVNGVSFLMGDITIYTDIRNQPPPARLRLRLRITYAIGGGQANTEQVDWSEPA
jgi:AP-1 complex subunit gamma-1